MGEEDRGWKGDNQDFGVPYECKNTCLRFIKELTTQSEFFQIQVKELVAYYIVYMSFYSRKFVKLSNEYKTFLKRHLWDN